MKPKIRDIIGQYRQMIREDGKVEPEQLKKMLLLEEVLPAKYKADEPLNEIIRLISKPIPKKRVYVKKELTPEVQKLHTDFMELYNSGLNDDEIAERLDVNYHQARYLRLKYNLESNSAKRLEEKYKKAMKYYKQGLSDKKIAEKVELSSVSIFNWRKDNELPSNYKAMGGRNNGNETNDNNKH